MKHLIKYLVVIICFTPVVIWGQITSVQSGLWTSGTTWSLGAVPTSNEDIVISSSHTITIVDSNAVCHSLSFADTSAHLDLDSNSTLSIFGDFSLFDETHNVFSAGWSATNAKVRFCGQGDQWIKNFKHLGPSTSFRDLVIDKDSGKVITDTLKLQTIGIQNSLEIKRGEFVLSSQDDIEGRYASSVSLGATPTITIHPEGIFTMMGSTSHIRKNTNNEPIGKMIIYGLATVTTTSTNRINLSGIDIEEGGRLTITTGWSANKLNPGRVIVKNGGLLRNSTTSNVWIDTAIVELQRGGIYETSSATTIFPINFVNNGTVRYMRNTSAGDQTIADMDYYRLEVSFANTGTKKNWTVAADRIIYDSLEINNTAELVLSSTSSAMVTVNKVLRLTTGKINNSTANIKLADSVEISRATGEIVNSPIFGNTVDLKYTSSVTSVSTGKEFPTANVLRDLTIYSTGQIVTLETDAILNGTLTLSTGDIDNDGSMNNKTLTIADGATIRRASGTLLVSPVFSNSVNLEYISTLYHVTTGNEQPANSTALNNLTITGDQGITLGSDIAVNGTVLLTGSEITTGDYKVILNQGASLDESAGKNVIGNVLVSRNLAQSVNENFGGVGLEINAAGAAPGITEVIRINNQRPAVFGCRRHFKITPSNNAGLNATIKYFYTDYEVGILNESNMVLYKSADNGINWSKQGGVIDVNNNNILLSGVNDFSLWALNDKDNPIVGIQSEEELQPKEFTISQNYPNPFNPNTTIEFTLAEEGTTELKVFNIIGQEISTLFKEEGKSGQIYRINFNASGLPSGIYFAKLIQGSNQIVKKMILMK